MSVRVLLVDDEPLVGLYLQAYLEDEGMQTRYVNSAERALEVVGAGERFDVCVMDLRLPGMDGNTAMRALAELEPSLRFMVHTGSAHYSVPDDLRAIGLCEDDLFVKPVEDMSVLANRARALAAS